MPKNRKVYTFHANTTRAVQRRTHIGFKQKNPHVGGWNYLALCGELVTGREMIEANGDGPFCRSCANVVDAISRVAAGA